MTRESNNEHRHCIPNPLNTDSGWLWVHKILIPVGMLLLTATVSIGGFIGAKVWDRVETGLTNLDGRVDVLEVDTARSSGTRFTAQNWSEAKARIDEDRSIIDRRITRVEESIPQIKESLMRIERKLDRTPVE